MKTKSRVNEAGVYTERAGTKGGKQFVKQPKKVAEKTARYR